MANADADAYAVVVVVVSIAIALFLLLIFFVLLCVFVIWHVCRSGCARELSFTTRSLNGPTQIHVM